MECVIDTSVLIDYIILDSETHDKAKNGLERIDNGIVPGVVIEELVYALGRLGFDKKLISDKLKEVLESYEVINVNEDNISEAEKIIMSEEKTSFKRFNDKLILSIAKQKEVPLFTFDRELNEECEVYEVRPFAKEII